MSNGYNVTNTTLVTTQSGNTVATSVVAPTGAVTALSSANAPWIVVVKQVNPILPSAGVHVIVTTPYAGIYGVDIFITSSANASLLEALVCKPRYPVTYNAPIFAG